MNQTGIKNKNIQLERMPP